MSKNPKDVENVDVSTEVSVDNTVEACAYLVKKEDGFYVEQGEEILGPCKRRFIKNEGDWVILPDNAANRKMIKLIAVEKFFDEQGDDARLPLAFKATRSLGSTSNKLPNEKLIAYLPEDLQEEYKAIIARAIQARDAERAAAKKPLTEADKARAKVTKAIEQLKALGMSEADIKALIENAANNTEEVQA